MSFRRLLISDVTVYRRSPTGPADGYGLPTLETSTVFYPRAGWVEQADSVEVIVGRDTVVSDWELTVGPEVTVGALDQVRVSGVAPLFEVVGSPSIANTPRGVHHFTARLRSIDDTGAAAVVGAFHVLLADGADRLLLQSGDLLELAAGG